MARTVSTNKVKAAFLAGNLTCLFVVSIVALFVGYRIGFANLTDKMRSVFFAQRPSAIECTDEVLAELESIHAVIENAGNPTNVKEHDSLMVEPDEQMTYRLRPNVEIEGYVLNSVSNFNIDPPVLYMNASSQLSSGALSWIQQQQRNHFTYTTTSDGHRTTLPVIQSERRCLLVGDSVCFGIGVNDDTTIASLLQGKLKPEVQVLNAGVGGYDGGQACRTAIQLSTGTEYERLIYVACDNDFNDESPIDVMRRFSEIKERFNDSICVLYTPYLEYVKGDVIYGGVGSDNWNQKGDGRREGCRKACDELGLMFLDLTDQIRTYESEKETVFAGFELYSDHCHFSVAGNQLAADLLFSRLFGTDEKGTSQQ